MKNDFLNTFLLQIFRDIQIQIVSASCSYLFMYSITTIDDNLELTYILYFNNFYLNI